MSLLVRKRWPARDELRPQLAVVVDLAVVDERDAAVLGRPSAAGRRWEVDDRRAAGGQGDVASDHDASSSGPRCSSASVIRPTLRRSSSPTPAGTWIPQMPHMRHALRLRGRAAAGRRKRAASISARKNSSPAHPCSSPQPARSRDVIVWAPKRRSVSQATRKTPRGSPRRRARPSGRRDLPEAAVVPHRDGHVGRKGVDDQGGRRPVGCRGRARAPRGRRAPTGTAPTRPPGGRLRCG